MHWESRNTRAKRAFCSHTAICSHIRRGVIQGQAVRCTAAKLGAKRGSHAHTTPHSGLVLHHASLCLHESLLLEQLLEGLVAVRAEVNALTLVAVLVEDHEIRIVVIDPPHFEELVVLEFFFLPKKAADLRELVQLSPRARLEAAVSRLVGIQLFAYTVLALAVRCASLRLALRSRGGQRAQQHSAHQNPHTLIFSDGACRCRALLVESADRAV